MRTTTRFAATTLAAALLLPAGAATAAAPTAATGSATQITAGGARLNGSVDPNGEQTAVYFEYGPTNRYGSRTADAAAGAGTRARSVSSLVGGLRPNTVYHYRLVASNPSGVRSGRDRTFRTRPQPPGFQFGAAPNPVTFRFPATVAGVLTGTNRANRPIALQTRAFPYTTGFRDTGTQVVTNGAGQFAFPVPAPEATAQYRVRTVSGQPAVVSQIVTLGVAVRVKTNVSRTRVRSGGLVRFSGTIRPARPGARYAIQKQTRTGNWATVAGSITRTGTATFSGFSRRVRVRRGGTYRVFVQIVDGNLTSGIGRAIRIRTR
jgi:hypothetical protein